MFAHELDPNFRWFSAYRFTQNTTIARKAFDRLVAANEIDHVASGGKIWVPIRRDHGCTCGLEQVSSSVDWSLRFDHD